MAEDNGKHVFYDSPVNLDCEWERRNWIQWLHCDERELRHAVEAVGSDPDTVRRFLRQGR